jgi:capsular exopolysaccharide synthesis family protein
MTSMQDVRPRSGQFGEVIAVGKPAQIIAEIEDATANSPIFETVADRYRQIAARCLDTNRPAKSQSIAISSATIGDGTSSVAIGIAIAAARNIGNDVLILETDMQRPQLAQDFGHDVMLGLSDYLSSDIELKSVLQETHASKVWLLPAGRRTVNPGPLIRSTKFHDLMTTLHNSFKTIIIDTPPLLTSPHAAVITAHADAAVLVVRAGYTHEQDAANALKVLGQTPIRGVVLNRTRQWLPTWLMRLCGISPFEID